MRIKSLSLPIRIRHWDLAAASEIVSYRYTDLPENVIDYPVLGAEIPLTSIICHVENSR